MDFYAALIHRLDGFLWGFPLIIILFGTHIYLTILLRFPQRYIWKGIKLSIARDSDSEGDISQFGALATALAATIGTGNIVGVATAVALGGPGAVFWLWLPGIFGIATKYAEALLSVTYRIKDADGMMAGSRPLCWLYTTWRDKKYVNSSPEAMRRVFTVFCGMDAMMPACRFQPAYTFRVCWQEKPSGHSK